jgi:hypothetical protein
VERKTSRKAKKMESRKKLWVENRKNSKFDKYNHKEAFCVLGNAIFYSDEDTDDNEEKCFIVCKVPIRSSPPFSAIDSFLEDLDDCQEELTCLLSFEIRLKNSR